MICEFYIWDYENELISVKEMFPYAYLKIDMFNDNKIRLKVKIKRKEDYIEVLNLTSKIEEKMKEIEDDEKEESITCLRMGYKKKELECFKIANNVLYFDDNSDFQTALWEILEVLKPELFEEECPELDFIDEIEIEE